MIAYIVWYLIGGCVYLFLDALIGAKELKKMDSNTLVFATAIAGLFWPIVLLVQIFLITVALALKFSNFFTKESK